MSDEEVLALSIDNPSLFETIVDRYQEAFLRKAERILGARGDAEDVVQDAFTKIYFNAHRFKKVEGASFKSWAYKILINTTFTHYQKLKKEGSFMSKLDPEIYEILPDLNEESRFEDKTLRDYIVSIFSKMPRDLARVLELHFLEGRPHKDIAEQEGVSIAAVKTRVYRAKKLFRKFDPSFNEDEQS